MAYKVLMGFKENGTDKLNPTYYHTGEMYDGKNAENLEKAGFIEQVLEKKVEADMELEPKAKKGK